MTARVPRKRVAIVGAGIGGLSAARALVRAGACEVTLFERAERAGGVMGTSRVDGFVREHAANGFLPVRDGTGAIDLAIELGVDVVEAAPAAQLRWIYRHGRLHALPTSPAAFLKSELLSWRGKLAPFLEPLRSRYRGPDESIHAFASRRLGPEIADALVAPFVTGIFASSARDVSAQAGFPKLVALEQRGGLLVGQIRTQLARLRARRQGGGAAAGKSAPGQSASEKSAHKRLSAPRGGVSQLIDALAADLGDTLVTGAEIARVAPGPVVHLGDGSQHPVDAVVLATPAHVGADLCRQGSPELGRALDAFSYAPVAVAYLGYKRSDIDHPLNGFGFLVTEGEDLRILGCGFESVVYPGRAPADHVLLRCIYGGSRDPSIMGLSDAELLVQARRDVDGALGKLAHVPPVHSHVVRWPRAIAQYNIGHIERVRRAEILAGPMGIALAGSAYHGVAVNSVVADAERVVREVHELCGVTPTGHA